MKEKNILASNIKYLFFAVMFIAAMLFMMGRVNAEPTDYVESNYKGVVKSPDGAGAKMFTAPGSKNPRTILADGTEVTLPDGTEVIISMEQKDPDNDMWYEVSVTFKDEALTGYLYSGRVNRTDAVPFTPTPTPEQADPTEAPVEPTEEITPEITSPDSAFTNPDATTDESTEKLVKDSNTFKPWIFIIILIIIIVVFMIVYTFWVKMSEEKLEKEIERYSNRPQYEPLEGELAEDYEAAKSNYYDHIGLGDQSGKSLGEVIGNPEEVQLDMTGIFDDEPAANTYDDADKGDNLKDLIASLEMSLGDKAKDIVDWTREEEDNDWASSEPSAEWSDEEPAEIFEEEETWNEEGHDIPEEIADEEFADQDFEEEWTEEKSDILEELEKETPYEPVVRKSRRANPVDDVRTYLDNLKEGDIITHKVYGEGKIVDNSDDQIIQVSFGDDMRFLKKEKLVMKNLIKF